MLNPSALRIVMEKKPTVSHNSITIFIFEMEMSKCKEENVEQLHLASISHKVKTIEYNEWREAVSEREGAQLCKQFTILWSRRRTTLLWIMICLAKWCVASSTQVSTIYKYKFTLKTHKQLVFDPDEISSIEMFKYHKIYYFPLGNLINSFQLSHRYIYVYWQSIFRRGRSRYFFRWWINNESHLNSKQVSCSTEVCFVLFSSELSRCQQNSFI